MNTSNRTNTRRMQVLRVITNFTSKGFLPTRQTIAAAMDWPINRISGRVSELIQAGDIIEDGSIYSSSTGRCRYLLRAV